MIQSFMLAYVVPKETADPGKDLFVCLELTMSLLILFQSHQDCVSLEQAQSSAASLPQTPHMTPHQVSYKLGQNSSHESGMFNFSTSLWAKGKIRACQS